MPKNMFVPNSIQAVEMKNYGKIRYFKCDTFSRLNLIIGENGTGKTFLLKSIYSAVKTIEDCNRGDDVRSANEILAEKLRWTFQTEKIGDLVTKPTTEPLLFSMKLNNNIFGYQFSKDTNSKIVNLENTFQSRESNSIFIPAKEVLSLYNIILKSREVDRAFGFDDTYYDLVKSLRVSPQRGRNYNVLAKSRTALKDLINGKVELNDAENKWYYKVKNQKIAIGATSEGIKKLAILDRLFSNGYLGKGSIVFIDELESALHPSAISKFIDMIDDISKELEVQFFIASHSYFVIKKLCLLAKQDNEPVTCISLNIDGTTTVNDLSEGMPENSIINESIRLYEEEIDQVF